MRVRVRVEERRHLGEGHERRLALDGGGAVASEVGHRLAVEHLTGWGWAVGDASARAELGDLSCWIVWCAACVA